MRDGPGAAAADVGLANERTALAWQRTALSLAAAAAILGRLTFTRVGFLAVAVLGVALLLCGWVFTESRWRYHQHSGVRSRRQPRGGRATLALATAAILIALTELVALLSEA